MIAGWKNNILITFVWKCIGTLDRYQVNTSVGFNQIDATIVCLYMMSHLFTLHLTVSIGIICGIVPDVYLRCIHIIDAAVWNRPYLGSTEAFVVDTISGAAKCRV